MVRVYGDDDTPRARSRDLRKRLTALALVACLVLGLAPFLMALFL